MVSYMNAYLIFQRMGLVPFNFDVGQWTEDLTQGMRNFMPQFNPNDRSDATLRFVNTNKAFEYL